MFDIFLSTREVFQMHIIADTQYCDQAILSPPRIFTQTWSSLC